MQLGRKFYFQSVITSSFCFVYSLFFVVIIFKFEILHISLNLSYENNKVPTSDIVSTVSQSDSSIIVDILRSGWLTDSVSIPGYFSAKRVDVKPLSLICCVDKNSISRTGEYWHCFYWRHWSFPFTCFKWVKGCSHWFYSFYWFSTMNCLYVASLIVVVELRTTFHNTFILLRSIIKYENLTNFYSKYTQSNGISR